MKRINERPSYILTASRSEMIVSVETPCPATVRVKVPAISAMAGARFVVNIDGTDYLTDYAVAEANRARSRISDRNNYFLDRIDSLKMLIILFKQFFPDDWSRLIYPGTVRSLIQIAETECNKSDDL